MAGGRVRMDVNGQRGAYVGLNRKLLGIRK